MIGERIRRKRLAAGLALQDVVDRLRELNVGLSKAALSNYETDKAIPNAKTLWAIAKILDTTLDYFMSNRDVAISLKGYRKRSKLTDKRLDQIEAFVREEIEKRMEIDELLGREATASVAEPVNINNPEEAEEIAEKQRRAWGVGDRPIASVIALLEDAGWYVIEAPDDREFDGLAGYVEATRRPFAVSRKCVPIDRKRLNLLHEAGHLFASSSDKKTAEKVAFRFGAALLFPKSRVFEEIGRRRTSLDLDELLIVKKKYGLSVAAIVYRLRDLGIITDSHLAILFAYMGKMGIRVEEPGSDTLNFEETPMAFKKDVLRAWAEGLITEQDVHRFLPGYRPRAEALPPKSSTDIKRLLSLPKEERDRILEVAAAAAAEDYAGPDVSWAQFAEDIYDDTKTR